MPTTGIIPPRIREGVWWILAFTAIMALLLAMHVHPMFVCIAALGFGLNMWNQAKYVYGLFDDEDQRDYYESGSGLILSVTILPGLYLCALVGLGLVAIMILGLAETQPFLGALLELLTIAGCLLAAAWFCIYSLVLFFPSKRRAEYQKVHRLVLD